MDSHKQDSNTNNALGGADFDRLINESFDSQLYNADKIKQGELIEGKVLSITDEDVFLDVGIKTQGLIPISEFADDEVPAIGDKIEATVVSRSIDNVRLSYAKAKEHKALDILKNHFKNSIPVLGSVKEIVPGGFTVIILDSFPAFVPISQIDEKHVEEEDMKNYIGNSYEFLIQKLFQNRHLNPVLSRKQLLTSEAHHKREEFFKTKQIGDIVEGTVKNHTAFGLFIDLGGFDGLLHVSDMGWSRHTRPSSMAPDGTTLKLKIIKLDPENKKINLSLKELMPNPWDNIRDRYKEGESVKGEVIKILPYGAFVHLEDAVEGFVHISELSWVKRIEHPREVLDLNSIVECKILSIDEDQKRISLGVKQIQKNPWDDIESKYPVGLKVRVTVKKTTRSGAVVEFEDGFTGFIPLNEYSWNKKSKPALKIGEEIDAKIISHDYTRHEMKLSIKELSDNPWHTLDIVAGTVIEGTITNIADFGVFVRINDDVEGLIPKSQCYDPREHGSFEDVQSKFVKGESIQVYVKEINPKTERLMLSVRDLKEMSSKQEMEKHMVGKADDPHLFSLGDMINKSEGEE